MHALEELQADFECELLFVESGGDNLAANYSRELADYIIYVVSVSPSGVSALLTQTLRLTWPAATRCPARVAPESLSLTCW